MKAKFSLSLIALIASAGLLVGCSQLGGRTDAQIATDIQQKLLADTGVPTKTISINSDKGVVTLSGNVSSDAERASAANDAAQIKGVKTVVNNLTVAPPQPQVAQAAPAAQPAPAPAPAFTPAPRPSAYRSRSSHTPRYDTGGGQRSENPSTETSSGGQQAQQTYTPPPAPIAPPKPTTVTIPAGTTVSVRLDEALNSNKNHTGDVFHGSLDQPVSIEDQIAIPAGAEVTGRVVDAKAANRLAGKPFLSLEITQISYNGHFYQVRTEPFTREGSSRGKRTATGAGGGAAIGAVIGAIAGGGRGAAIGAATGAGAGTGVSAATGQDDVKLPSETVLNFSLMSPVTVAPASKSSRYASDQQQQQ
jgi:hypothetical protein